MTNSRISNVYVSKDILVQMPSTMKMAIKSLVGDGCSSMFIEDMEKIPSIFAAGKPYKDTEIIAEMIVQ